MAGWIISILKGATFEATITMSGVANIATATEWRLRCVDNNNSSILTASSIGASPMLVSLSSNSFRLTVPAATTAAMTVQNGFYDFEIVWADGSIRRYISRGDMQVLQKAGT